MSKIPYLITSCGLTVYLQGQSPIQISAEHRFYDSVLDAIRNEDEEQIIQLATLAKQTENYMQGKVQVIGGQLLYNGEVVSGALVDRILELKSQGFEPTGMINFLANLQENPSYQSREELYLFLEACGDLPITEDGCFIAYKWVRDNYTDTHSGKFDNSVGTVVKMSRASVDDNRNNTCSAGLHVCSNKYCKFGDRLMLVKVNPRDVVSVPYDYDNGKMRVCEYKVIDEVKKAEYVNFSKPVVDEEEDDDYYY